MGSRALVCRLESLVHFMENCEDKFGNGNHLYFVSCFFFYFFFVDKGRIGNGKGFSAELLLISLFIDEISIHAVVNVCCTIAKRVTVLFQFTWDQCLRVYQRADIESRDDR